MSLFNEGINWALSIPQDARVTPMKCPPDATARGLAVTRQRTYWHREVSTSQAPPRWTGAVTSEFFELIGGETTLRTLVARFYAGVAEDPVLRPLYPEADLAPAAERLALFLIQYWGGPGTYSERRGHPRLRMRHAPFVIGLTERDAWLGHMRAALDSLNLQPDAAQRLWSYLSLAADSLRNSAD